MTPSQLKVALARLRLSQMALARLFDQAPRTVRRWIAGDARVPATATALLRLAVSGKITIRDIEEALR